jgi:Cu(I)/Ag(I) efflux system membrane fusion protein
LRATAIDDAALIGGKFNVRLPIFFVPRRRTMKFPSDIRIFLERRMSRRTRTVVAMAVVAVIAFVLGGLILGDGGSSEVRQAEHGAESSVSAPTIWTCSMHPQIKLPKPGKCPMCFMDLIPLDTSGGEDLGPRQLRLSETAKQLARIQTTPAVRAFAETEVRMVGNITYDETRVAYITAWVSGRLDRLYADYTGVPVNKGEHLVYIYSPELLAAQEELIQAHEAISSLSGTSSEVLLSTARATLDAARDKLRLFGLTAPQIDRIENSREVSDHLTIYAPIGGIVVHKNALEGMYVKTGTRIYTIADLSKLWVIFEAYESDLPWLRFGQRVEFTSQSFPGERFEATISFIDPLVDPKTRTVRVRAVVDNSGGRLKPYMFVRGVLKSRIDREGKIVDVRLSGKWIAPMHPEIIKDGPGKCEICGMDLVPAASLGYASGTTEGGETPLLIPASAPLITGKRAVVYVEIPSDEGPLFEGREVELGPRAGDYYVVKSGIEEGELVVTNGAFKIDSELQIQAKPSMMSPAGGAPAPGKIEADGAARKALAPVYDAYFEVRVALAADDLDVAKNAAAAFSAAIRKVDMSVFTGKGHMRWMDLSKSLSESADRITKAKDIDAARDAFFHLSKSTIDLHGDFGHTGNRSFYLSFCPMARDGDGAYWLQENDELRNPYYGASMLYCGSVKKTFTAVSGGKK